MSAEDGTVDIHTEKLPLDGTLLHFAYVNHKGESHTYLVELNNDSLVFEPNEYIYPTQPDLKVWNIRANVIERDDEPRPGERLFVLVKMTGMTEIVDRRR